MLDKLINYSLVCIQIAYPYIYNQLTEEPDFKNWNDKIASKLKLRPLTEEEIERLNSTEEFDDDWEKVVFRMCQKETYLSNRAFCVSALLNKIAESINDDEQLGAIIESTIEMSAVTNLKAFDSPKKLEAKFPWGEKVWEPVKASLAANNIALKAPKTSQNWIVFKLKSKDMLILRNFRSRNCGIFLYRPASLQRPPTAQAFMSATEHTLPHYTTLRPQGGRPKPSLSIFRKSRLNGRPKG